MTEAAVDCATTVSPRESRDNARDEDDLAESGESIEWGDDEEDRAVDAGLAAWLAARDAEMEKQKAEEESEESYCSEECVLPNDRFSIPIEMRTNEEFHEACLNRFDTEYKASYNPRDAREFEEKAIVRLDKWMRNDYDTVLSDNPVEAGSQKSNVIPAGIGDMYAAVLLVDPEQDTRPNAELRRIAEAAQFVGGVLKDIEAATKIDELEKLDRIYCTRAGDDEFVAAAFPQVKGALGLRIADMEAKAEAASKKRLEAEEKGEEPDADEEAISRAGKELMEKAGLKPEHPMAHNVDVTSAVNRRAIDVIEAFDLDATAPGKNKVVTLTMREKALSEMPARVEEKLRQRAETALKEEQAIRRREAWDAQEAITTPTERQEEIEKAIGITKELLEKFPEQSAESGIVEKLASLIAEDDAIVEAKKHRHEAAEAALHEPLDVEMFLRPQDEVKDKKRKFDCAGTLRVAKLDDYGRSRIPWTTPRHSAVRTTGAVAVHKFELASGESRRISIYNMSTGKRIFTINLAEDWGGVVTQVALNERFVTATFEYPAGMPTATVCNGLVYNRKTNQGLALNTGFVGLSCVVPEPDRDSYWLGTTFGSAFCVSWEERNFDMSVQCMSILPTISPVMRIHRIGRVAHFMTACDVFSQDVIPLETESLEGMARRAGAPRRHQLVFPSTMGRWGTIQVVLQRDYDLRMICGDMVRVLPGTEAQQKQTKLEASPLNQHLVFDRNRLAVLYGDGILRLMWPGDTATQYETEEAAEARAKLNEMAKAQLAVDTKEEEESTVSVRRGIQDAMKHEFLSPADGAEAMLSGKLPPPVARSTTQKE